MKPDNINEETWIHFTSWKHLLALARSGKPFNLCIRLGSGAKVKLANFTPGDVFTGEWEMPFDDVPVEDLRECQAIVNALLAAAGHGPILIARDLSIEAMAEALIASTEETNSPICKQAKGEQQHEQD